MRKPTKEHERRLREALDMVLELNRDRKLETQRPAPLSQHELECSRCVNGTALDAGERCECGRYVSCDGEEGVN